MKTSIFDLFRIGIGPSSSHTVGPMRAAREFGFALHQSGRIEETRSLTVDLYGSLALTGRGHHTDKAILLGLSGEQPDSVDPDSIGRRLDEIRATGALSLLGRHAVPFDERRDLRFHGGATLPGHPNAMRFTALDGFDGAIASEIFYSIGGGAIRREGESCHQRERLPGLPHPFSNAAELVEVSEHAGLPIWALVLANEAAIRSEDQVRAGVLRIWQTMQECMGRGLTASGSLPGGLNVRRRAPEIYARLARPGAPDPLEFIDWLNVFAMAVNEENAAGGRVVTAPTNGAAGIVPAVAQYYRRFIPDSSEEGILRYFLTAGAIGILYKENASISGAEVGCQGEVGVACSMAAGGLVGALEGGNAQVEHAAEIAMEHHLGMTCDPIAGLVQIPCIERNAMGAVKAVNACRLAMQEDGEHKVSLDQVIRTMYVTGLDMQSRYKETSLAGLAVNAVEC